MDTRSNGKGMVEMVGMVGMKMGMATPTAALSVCDVANCVVARTALTRFLQFEIDEQ